jgi:hypothetical protein
LWLGVGNFFHSKYESQQLKRSCLMSEHSSVASTKVLRHVVLFGFKATTTPEQVQEIERAFAALPAQINIIRAFEWGTDVNVARAHAGYTHCFLVTFSSEADCAAYDRHPAHQVFVALVQPHVAQVLVLDYWAQA